MEEESPVQKLASKSAHVSKDEVTVLPLDPKLVDDAIKEELMFMRKLRVHHEVPVSYLDKSGSKAIGARELIVRSHSEPAMSALRDAVEKRKLQIKIIRYYYYLCLLRYLHYLDHLFDFCLRNYLYTLTGIKQAASTSFHTVSSHCPHPYKDSDPAAPKHLPRARTKPPAQRLSLTFIVVSCNPHVLQFTDKTTETLTTHTTRSTSSSDMAICRGVAFQNVASLSKDVACAVACGRHVEQASCMSLLLCALDACGSSSFLF